MFGFSKKDKSISTQPVQTKTSASTFVDNIFSAYGAGISGSIVAPVIAYKLYNKIGPLQGAVSRVSRGVSELPLVLKDKINPEKMVKESPILDILEKPSPLTTKKEFLNSCNLSLMLTRELYVVARGQPNKPPIELVYVPPYAITMIQDTQNMWPISIYTNINGERNHYFREEIKGRFRYLDNMKMNEIYPFISEQNSSQDAGTFRGTSPLTAIKDELLSYSSSVESNGKGIENSGRPSGIITPEDDELDPGQYDELQKSLEENATGIMNSGKLLLLPARIRAAFPQWAPRDMDYDTLQNNVKTVIWNIYSIPFPLVSENGQTFSNYSEAQTAIYDEAINKAWGVVSDALGWILESRYDMTGFVLGYNQFDVPALKRRAIEQLKELEESQVLTVNEIRESVGYDEVENGDEILVTSGKTTLDAVIAAPSFAFGNLDNTPENKPPSKE